MNADIFHIGRHAINSYAFMLSIAFFVGIVFAANRAKRYGVPLRQTVNLGLVVIIASLVGARSLYVIEHADRFFGNVRKMLLIQNGGLSYHGALVFALLAGYLWHRRNNIRFGNILDAVAPSVALGFFLVRIGCVLNGCCFGKPTQMPWGIAFPANSPAGQVYPDTCLHPTQLYASVSAFLTCLLLLGIEKYPKWPQGKGLLFLSLIFLSSTWRFIIEFFRYQDRSGSMIASLTLVQTYCLAISITCVILIACLCRAPSSFALMTRWVITKHQNRTEVSAAK